MPRNDRAMILPARVKLGLLLMLCGLAACEAPAFEGPQLQIPPEGFLLKPETRAQRTMFAQRSEVHHDAWIQALPPYSTIDINGYPGTLTIDDVIDAQEYARAHAEHPQMVFGGIEPLTIDGRPALAWEERLGSSVRGVPWVAYRIMIPYDTISYTIDLATEDPVLVAGAPGTLREIASTFAVGETVYNWPLITVGAILLLLAANLLHRKSRAKAERMQSLNLVQIAHDEEPESPLEPTTTLAGAGVSEGAESGQRLTQDE